MITLVAFFLGATSGAQAAPGEPSMIRYFVQETFTATAVDPDATGSVQAVVKRDGKVDRRRLRVAMAQLNPSASYTLLAQMGDEPNLFAVTNFTTTPAGRGGVLYIQNRVLNRPVAPRSTRRSLPEMIAPVTRVRAIAIANANDEIVLTASLHDSPSMNFEMATVLENTGHDLQVVGCVAVACNNGGVQFRLLATGQSGDFTFCVNETAVAKYPMDDSGRINVGILPAAAPSPLLFKKLSLRNASSEVVLESVIP